MIRYARRSARTRARSASATRVRRGRPHHELDQHADRDVATRDPAPARRRAVQLRIGGELARYEPDRDDAFDASSEDHDVRAIESPAALAQAVRRLRLPSGSLGCARATSWDSPGQVVASV